MDVTDTYIITQDFGEDSSLNYMFDVLMDVTKHFQSESNEDLKRNLKDDLCNKLEDLISNLETKIENLKDALATLK